MRLLIVNGPNLNLIGERETDVYGNRTFEEFIQNIKNEKNIDIEVYQSNVEGEIINALQGSDHDGIILNAGGFTHTSVAIHDCIKAISPQVLEVHISNITARESFRHTSLISPVAVGCIFGFGLESYSLAVDYFMNYLNNR